MISTTQTSYRKNTNLSYNYNVNLKATDNFDYE